MEAMEKVNSVLCLGDSITYGYPYGPDYSWVGLVAKNTGMVMYNHGLNGDTTGGMLTRFIKCIRSGSCSDNLRPNAVVITGGANDAWLGCGVLEVRHNISAMVDIALTQGIIPLLGITVPLNFEAAEHFISYSDAARVSKVLESYKSWMRDFAKGKDIKLVDFHACLGDPESNLGLGMYYADNAHPNQEGYRVMAKTAADALAGLGKKA